MSRQRVLTRQRLAWRQATHRRGWALALWYSMAAAIALPGLLLLTDAMVAESGLAATLARDGGFSVRQSVADVDAFNTLDRQVDARVSARVGPALVPLGATAAAGPLHLVTVRTEPAPAALAQRTLTATYAAHLASHVAVVAGELPAEGLGGGETAVAMPQAAADQLGLRLSDRLCADFSAAPGGQARWCARIVGLWRPLAADDPFWGGVTPRFVLTMGRYDLFQLAGLRPGQGPVATVRYWAGAGAVRTDDAPLLAARVTALTAELRSPQRQVDSRIDRSLLAFGDRQHTVSVAIHALAALVAVLGLASVAMVAGRFLDGQSRELALLRARGWSRGRASRVAFTGPALVGLTAAAAAVAACAIAAALLTASGAGVSVLALRAADAPGLLAALFAIAIALVALLAVLTAGTVWRDPEPSLRRRAGRSWPTGPGPAAAGVVAGLAVMALPHVPGLLAAATEAGAGWRDALFAAPALGAFLAAAGAVSLPAGRRVAGSGSLHGELAGLQLRRRPGQHAVATLLLTLAAAGTVFGALAATAGPGPDQPELRLGLYLAMGAGAGGGLLLGLAGFGLHFRSTARRRLHEYGGLFAHGLPPAQVTRSLGTEQAVTAGLAVVVGSALGIALALAVLPMPPPAGALAGLAAAGALGVGAALVAALSRRVPERVDPLRLQRQG
ncbi:MAG TPA: hypothetical protein VOB72_11930 [Candidatus Dormibacteraeota bacterium]|nr:hypothetical protein [Candidatus Dormibacteraeota bacterium]